MYLDNIKNTGQSIAASKSPPNIPAKAQDFLALVEEIQKASAAPDLTKAQSAEPEEQPQQEDWEQEWEAEQRRIERQRKMSDRAEEKRKQAALHRAAKRKRLLEYMLFLKETSIERSKEEMQRIEKRDEKDIDKTRIRKKAVYVPVNYAGSAVYSNIFDEYIK